MMKHKKLALLVTLLVCVASVAFADWYADRLKEGPILITNQATYNYTPFYSLQRKTVTFLGASVTTQSTTVAGLKSGDVAIAQPVRYTGTALITSTSCTTNKVYMKWTADPGTTVTVELLVMRTTDS